MIIGNAGCCDDINPHHYIVCERNFSRVCIGISGRNNSWVYKTLNRLYFDVYLFNFYSRISQRGTTLLCIAMTFLCPIDFKFV